MRYPELPSSALVALLSLALGACGETRVPNAATTTRGPTGGVVSSNASQVSPRAYRRDDGDKDSDDERRGPARENDDRGFLAEYGPEAERANRLTVAALVKRYFEWSAAGNGSGVCALLSSGLAASLAPAGSPAQGRDLCVASVTPMLRERHLQLVAEDPATMTVSQLRVKGGFALAVLSFQTSPKTAILLQREGRQWRVAALFDSPLP